MTSHKIYNVAVIGYGMSAKVFHIPLITVVPEFHLYAVVQRAPKPDDDAEKDHPGIKSYRSMEDMLEDSTVEVVVITTTPDTHYSLAKVALEHGKHVIVEKPFTPTHEEADELIAVAKHHRCHLTVYQNRRWDSDALTLSYLIRKHTLGRIVDFETHFDRYRPEPSKGNSWKTAVIPGGGAIYDLGTHLIDQIVCLFGLPKRITAFIGTQREGTWNGFEDSFTVLLHYDGMLATAKAAVVSPEVNQLRFWVRGDKGSFKKFHLDCQEDHLKQGKKPGDAGFGVESSDKHGQLPPEDAMLGTYTGTGLLMTSEDGQMSSQTWPTIEPVTYSTFYSQFAKALEGEGEVPVKPEDASAVIRLIELARQSSREWRTINV